MKVMKRVKQSKKRIPFKKIISITYIAVFIILVLHMFPHFGTQYSTDDSWLTAGWGDKIHIMRYVMFAVYLLSSTFWIHMDLVTLGDDIISSIGSIWQIIVFVLVFIATDGFYRFSHFMSEAMLIGSAPLAIVMNISTDGADGIGYLLLSILLYIIAIILSLIIQVLLCNLVHKNIYCLFYLADTDDSKSTSRSNNKSLGQEVGEILDTYNEYQIRKDIKRSADELEKIRFDLSRRK